MNRAFRACAVLLEILFMCATPLGVISDPEYAAKRGSCQLPLHKANRRLVVALSTTLYGGR